MIHVEKKVQGTRLAYEDAHEINREREQERKGERGGEGHKEKGTITGRSSDRGREGVRDRE